MNKDTQLVMLVPSRGRPGNIAELLDACMQTTTTDTQVAVLVDSDDPALPGYRAINYGGFAELWEADKQELPPPGKLCQILNAYAPGVAAHRPYVGFMGDDHRPRTRSWDARLMQALDRTGVSYGNDLLQGANLPTMCVISSALISALGYMCPPPCEHLYLDNFWKLLGTTAGNLAYLPDVVVEHCHPAAGKAPMDAGYAYSTSAETMTADHDRYEKFLAGPWLRDKKKVEPARNG
jgi:hypothetical protein